MPTKTRSLRYKSGSQKRKNRRTLREIQPVLPRQGRYRRNSTTFGINSTVQKKKKPFCRKNSRALRSARLRSRTRKDGGKLASAEQVCAVPSLRSIRRTILWC